MKTSELMQLLTNMQRQIENLEDRVSALENPVALDGETDSGGGPGEENGDGP